MNFEYLTVQDLIDLHDEVALARYDGLPGYDIKCIEARASMPQRGIGEMEFYPGIFKKAAVYMYYLIAIHCFKDGNKRTGYLAASTFLNLNGYRFDISDEDLYNKCIEIADRETRPSFEDVEKWIEENSIPYNYEDDITFDI